MQVDYCFPKVREQDPEPQTTLVAVDDAFDRGVAIPTERKGGKGPIAVRALAAFLQSLCQPRIILQCDSENAILDVTKRVCAELPYVRPRVTPVASKGSNGRVEQKSRAIEGVARTLLLSIGERYGVELPTDRPIIS